MKICIECQKDVAGLKAARVKEDRIINGIRAAKRFLRISLENELYVCEEHLEGQKKKRQEFEKSMLMFGVLAAAAVLLLLAMVMLSGRFDPLYLMYALLVGVFIIAFAVLFRYAPALETPEARPVGGTPAPAPAKAPEAEAKAETKQPAAKAGSRKKG